LTLSTRYPLNGETNNLCNSNFLVFGVMLSGANKMFTSEIVESHSREMLTGKHNDLLLQMQ